MAGYHPEHEVPDGRPEDSDSGSRVRGCGRGGPRWRRGVSPKCVR
jgi:hypothetical protein